MKIILIYLIVISLCLMGCGGATGVIPTSSTPPLIKVDSNLAATNVKAGMVYGKDFTITEDYQMTFIATIMCSDIHVTGNTLYYTVTQSPTYTPYFMWICYPQISKDSRATIIAIEDIRGSSQKSGTWTVIGVVRKDTSECLQEFGGTYGTKQAGW